MHTRFLVAAALGWGCEEKDDDTASGDESDADTDADADSDTDTDSDTDSDTDTFFFHAQGTFDDSTFELDCPPGLIAFWVKAAGFVAAGCDEVPHGKDPGHSIALFAADLAIGDVTKCSPTSIIGVGMGKKDAYFCDDGGVTSYDLNTTELTVSAKSTIWAGTFEMAGDDGTHSADVSGSFRVNAVVAE